MTTIREPKGLEQLRTLTDAIAFEIAAGMQGIGDTVATATKEGQRQYGATVYPILGNGGATAPVAQVIYAGACRLMGWSLTSVASTGSQAVLYDLYDGTSTDGDLLMVAGVVAPYGATASWFGPGGIALNNGLYIAIPAGIPEAPPVVGSFFIYPAGAM